MSHQEQHTVEEHPLTAVVLHWLHLVSFIALAFTGLAIHYDPLGWHMAYVIETHYVMMFVFICTTVVRIYWAFMGRGSADTGETKYIRDYKHFAINGRMARDIVPYIKYYLFISKTRPKTAKYNPLQAITYGYLFPLLIFLMALTGFSMYEPFGAYFGWFVTLMGGLNDVRLMHYLVCFVMLAVWLIHLYLVVMEDPIQVYSMLFYMMPEKYRPAFARKDAKAGAGAAG
jgi:Ni/Fe-hydrogenase 1 B-type cytochrome subunit